MDQRTTSLFNKWYWENCVNTNKAIKLNTYLTTLTKYTLEYIKDLNVRPYIIKHLEKNEKKGEAPRYLYWHGFFIYDKKKKHEQQ